MAIFITDETALDFWKWHCTTGSFLAKPSMSRISRISPEAPSPKEVVAACEPFMQEKGPVHVITSCGKCHRHSDSVKYSSFSGRLPNRSFYKIANGLFVASPEFAFVRVARKLPIVPLVMLGFEITGTFSFSDEDIRGFVKRDPITSPSSLKLFIDRAGSIPGAKIAKTAARHVIGNAASPREAELAVLLTFPKRLGGYGLPKPVLNYKLQCSNEASMHMKRSAIIVDAAWPKAKLALEYDSDQWHTGAEKIAADSERRNDINVLGFEVKTVTNREFSRMSAMDKIADGIAKRLNVRIRASYDDYPDRKIALRRELKGMESGPLQKII